MLRTGIKWFGILILVMFLVKHPDDAANAVSSVVNAALGIANGVSSVAAKIG